MTKNELAKFIIWVGDHLEFPGERVVLLRDEAQEMIGKIYIPDAAQRKEKAGYIVGVGAQVSGECIKPGARAIISTYDAIEIEVPYGDDSVVLSIVNEKDVYAVVAGGGVHVDLAPEKEGLEGLR